MQSSVIDEILKVEDQADKIVKSAKTKASEMIIAATEEAKNKSKDHLNELKMKHLKELDSLNEELNARLAEYKELSEKEDEEGTKLPEETLENMIKSVCSLLEGVDG